jgi:hypothetical protein
MQRVATYVNPCCCVVPCIWFYQILHCYCHCNALINSPGSQAHAGLGWLTGTAARMKMTPLLLKHVLLQQQLSGKLQLRGS